MAPSITVNSVLGKWMVGVIDTLAACPATLAFLGAANSVGAKAKIHLFSTPLPAGDEGEDNYIQAEWVSQINPTIVIVPPEGGQMRFRRIGTGPAWTIATRVQVFFQRILPDDDGRTTQDKDLEFQDAVSTILEQFCNLATTPGYVRVDQISEAGPMICALPKDLPELGDVQQWPFVFETGEE